MCNCFTLTYNTLKEAGVKVPESFIHNGVKYTTENMKVFIVDFQHFLDEKIHYAYFNSFCKQAKQAQKYDIIIDDNSIGVAINQFKYLTMRESSRRPCLDDIGSRTILRPTDG